MPGHFRPAVTLPHPMGAGASLNFAVNQAANRLATSADDDVLTRVRRRRVRSMLRLTDPGGVRVGGLVR
jgi:hypothetical protein